MRYLGFSSVKVPKQSALSREPGSDPRPQLRCAERKAFEDDFLVSPPPPHAHIPGILK